MALRVLLADESSSIKKVMQLALQDFGVEVKAVPIGVDVIPVAKSWNPDIIFADVLLQKKSGYDLCAEIKANQNLRQVPVVLMWSGFMEIDSAKVKACGSEKQLEKPFDSETLRSIIKELVPKLSDNKIANYITYPNLPDFVEKELAPPPNFAASSTNTDANAKIFAQSEIKYEPIELDEPEEFANIPLPHVSAQATKSTINNPEQSENWSSGTLDKFRIQIPKSEYPEVETSFSNLDSANIELTGAGEIQLGDLDHPGEKNRNTNTRPNSSTFEQTKTNLNSAANQINAQIFDPVHAEQILREQVKVVLQDIAWKILPDMTERIVREELQKLLKDAEKLS